MLINEQSNKGYLKIDQISIGSGKVKKGKRGERGQKWEIGPKRIILSWNANSLKWIPTRCKTVAILYAEGKEKSIIAACFSSFRSSSSFFSSSSFLPPLFKFTLGIASSLSLLTHREGIFRVNFLAVLSDIPQTGIYIFVGTLTSSHFSLSLSFTPSPYISLISALDFFLL